MNTLSLEKPRLFTTHGTVLYVDRASEELRHGHVSKIPSNARLILDSGNSRIVMIDESSAQGGVTCGPESSHVAGSERTAEGTLLEPHWLDGGWLGLKAENRFLCAEPDGRVTLSRKICGNWENFLPADPPLRSGAWRAEMVQESPSLSISCIETRPSEFSRAVRAVENTASCIRVEAIYWFSTHPFPGKVDCTEIVHVPIEHFSDYIENVNEVFIRYIPAAVKTDFNLVVQADGFAVNPQAWDPLFWEYDYIGGPFCGLWGGGPYWRGPFVGNGGFSLRSRKLYNALLELRPPWRVEDWVSTNEWLADFPYYITNARGEKCLTEDLIICLCARKYLEKDYEVRFCPPELAAKFSLFEPHPFTNYWLGKSFGFHGNAVASHYGVTL